MSKSRSNPPPPPAPLPDAPRIIGILNLTRDSHSDGGQFLDPDLAITRGRQLRRDGAAWIDLGAESSHPDAEDVSATEEIRRLTPVIQALKLDGATISVDTAKPAVMRHVLALGVDAINDITGLRAAETIAVVRDSPAALICMYNRTASDASGRAQRADLSTAALLDEIVAFFNERIATLTSAGIERGRLILDPGMGFFLGTQAALSLRVLRELPRLKSLGLPICVSPARKSFIGAVLADGAEPRPVAERAAGTLAAELWAAAQGADFIRTHDVRALHDALRVQAAIAQA